MRPHTLPPQPAAVRSVGEQAIVGNDESAEHLPTVTSILEPAAASHPVATSGGVIPGLVKRAGQTV